MNRLILSIIGLMLLQHKAIAQEFAMTPLTGANMYFSAQPFTTSSQGHKTHFSSADFIYGRIELPQTLWDAFEMKALRTHFLSLRCWVRIAKKGAEPGMWQSWDYMMVKRGDEKNKWLNFDLLPDPAKASTVMAAGWNFDPGVAAGPFYQQINPSNFSSKGEYSIYVRIYMETYDGWGKQKELAKWPCIEGSFDFTFNENDAATILANYSQANERIRAIRNKM